MSGEEMFDDIAKIAINLAISANTEWSQMMLRCVTNKRLDVGVRLFYRNGSSEWQRHILGGFELGEKCGEFVDKNSLSVTDRWTVLKLFIDNDGTYTYEYSYDDDPTLFMQE